MKSEKELEKLYLNELRRFHQVYEELLKEDEARNREPYEDIELPEELRNDPNYLPF